MDDIGILMNLEGRICKHIVVLLVRKENYSKSENFMCVNMCMGNLHVKVNVANYMISLHGAFHYSFAKQRQRSMYS